MNNERIMNSRALIESILTNDQSIMYVKWSTYVGGLLFKAVKPVFNPTFIKYPLFIHAEVVFIDRYNCIFSNTGNISVINDYSLLGLAALLKQTQINLSFLQVLPIWGVRLTSHVYVLVYVYIKRNHHRGSLPEFSLSSFFAPTRPPGAMLGGGQGWPTAKHR